MKKLFLMAVIMLSSVSIFAQSRVGTTTIQPKIGLNVSSVGDGDWKAGCVFGAELQHQFNAKAAIAGGLLYSFQGTKHDEYSWNPGYLNIPITLNYYVARNFALKAGIQPAFMVAKDEAKDVNTLLTLQFLWECLTSSTTSYWMLATTSVSQRFQSMATATPTCSS